MSTPLAAIVGGAAGAVALVGITAIITWFCLHKRKKSGASESGSSEQSSQVGQRMGTELQLLNIHLHPDMQKVRVFSLEELQVATKRFNEINLIGQGSFGLVYKGLLQNGMVVAIKRRRGTPRHEFVEEVQLLSRIRYRNLVTLLGYCQENEQLMLVYDYIPNGSISSHIFAQHSTAKLEFKQRLPTAIGAAKGLAHLHALSPPLIHKNFKTANVLVDEDFIAKVSDAGVKSLLERISNGASSLHMMGANIFLDPEVSLLGAFSEKSDVYSFGIFLLELVSGRSVESNQDLIEWAQSHPDLSESAAIIDERLGSSYTCEGMKEFLGLAVRCVDRSSGRRPHMSLVVLELERILENEMSLTTIMGEGTPIVTLGSQLFTST